MRLINVHTLEMQFFLPASSTPPYAILSHTWDTEEVTYQDYIDPMKKDNREALKGYQKIVKACELAKRQGHQYVWVDTCCIDKSSSAELTEAINSMYQWYKGSVVCYARLADLPSGAAVPSRGTDNALKGCRWFTRGWTLQELIAPSEVQFYDADWTFRGTRVDLCDAISEITNISQQVLLAPMVLDTLAVAERMSWAANRKTTREEDVAYCLLGIFDVNMPLLYGEGKRAFIRLQEEIAKESNDLSLFTWRAADDSQKHRGIIALSPDEFARGGGTKLIGNTVYNPEFTITNKGVKMSCPVLNGGDGLHIIMLNCTQEVNGKDTPVGIWLKSHGDDVYSRALPHYLGVLSKETTTNPTLIYVLKTISPSLSNTLSSSHAGGFMFRKNFNWANTTANPDFIFHGAKMGPVSAWDPLRSRFVTGGKAKFSGFMLFMGARSPSFPKHKLSQANTFLVVFGKSGQDGEPWVTIGNVFDHPELYNAMNANMDMAEVARKNIRHSIDLRTKRAMPGPKLWVKMEEDVVDGESLYCIDLYMTREWEEDGAVVSLDDA